MSNKVKDISIENRTYYFFNDSNIKSLTNKLASKGLQKKFLFTAWICDDMCEYSKFRNT